VTALLGRLALARVDLILLGSLTAVAFVLRFFSPIMPDLFTHPFRQAPISNCVRSTPTDAAAHLGTVCGLAYPFQRGYQSNPTAERQPPEGEIFDEIYFGVFAHNDLKGKNYFDPEPPTSKLIIAAGELGWGWFRATFQGANGDYADLGFNPFGWRLMSCIFGTLCVPMMYLLARRLWPVSRLFAIAAGVLVCFDGMFFVQSRIGMIDIFPIFFIITSYWLFAVHLASRRSWDSLLTMTLLGTMLGIAISSKWISLAAWATIILFLGIRFLTAVPAIATWMGESLLGRVRDGVMGPLVPGGARLGTYAAVTAGSLLLIPLLIYIVSWIPFFERGQFQSMADLIRYQQQAYNYHAHLTASHPYGSYWWSWPWLGRPVAYYYDYLGIGTDDWSHANLVGGIINLGNPWIWWTSLPCLLALPYFVIRRRSFPAALILVGFLSQWLPFSRVTRVMFMYHMFGGLTFMILALDFVLAAVAKELHDRGQEGGPRLLPSVGRWIVYAHLGVAVLFFAYFYPVWTATPIADRAYLSGFPAGKMWFNNCIDRHDPRQPHVVCWI
jgi:dolichyl-phosphate-mannose--protein O-mannosyl transferase